MAQHNEIGREGEVLATEHLIKQGYTIREVNWRSGKLELDIVAYKDVTLVVVEVKTRSSLLYDNPTDAITRKKIKHIVDATDAYIRLFDTPFEVRFDVITLTKEDGGYRLEHIEDAFYPPLR